MEDTLPDSKRIVDRCVMSCDQNIYLEDGPEVDEYVRWPEVPMNYARFSEAPQTPRNLPEKILDLNEWHSVDVLFKVVPLFHA